MPLGKGRRFDDREKVMRADLGVMKMKEGPRAREYGWLLEVAKVKDTMLPSEMPEGTRPTNTLTLAQ